MPDNAGDVDSALAALRQKYVARLKDRERDIIKLLQHRDTRGLSDDENEQLRIHAHSLAGSGATYGYPAISQAGRALERALGSGAAAKEYLPLVQTLIEACREAAYPPPKAFVPSAAQNGGQAGQKPGVQKQKKQNLSSIVSRRKHLLVIDDDPAVHEFVTELLKGQAFVTAAHDAASGINAIREERPDLVLLDVTMPGPGGATVLQNVRADNNVKDTPVLMLTANNTSEHVTQAMAAGALGYVVKPFEPAGFADKLREIFDRLDTTVLVADDDDAIRDLLEHKFRAAGVKVICAASGGEALELATARCPNLILADWVMPGIDGLALLRKLKNGPRTKNAMVVMLTVKHQEQDVLDGLRMGAADYIVKPFLPDEVITRCFRLLGLGGTARA